jgi:hypothetical protein
MSVSDARTEEAREAAWGQLEKDLARKVDAAPLDSLRSSLHLSIGNAVLHDNGVVVCSLGLWSFYSTLDVSMDTATDAIVRWHFEALSEPAGEVALDEAAAVRTAQEHLKVRSGAQGPTVAWQDGEAGSRNARVYWWHTEDGINVEGDYVAVLVNGSTGKVFSLSDKWRSVDLPRLRARSRVSAAQARTIADAHMGRALARFDPGSPPDMNIIEVPTESAAEPPVTDRLVWRTRYTSTDGMALVEVSVDSETGRVVRTTGW